MMARAFIGILICVASCFLYAQIPLYDGTLFATKASDWRAFIPTDVYVAYQSQFTFPSGTGELPSQASVESVADTAFASGVTYVCIDIESWPTTTAVQRAATKAKVEQTVSWFKARQPTLQVGWFSWTPTVNYDAAIQGDGAADYETWQALNDSFSFASSVDVLFPSLYVLSYEASPYTNTFAYINANLSEAVRVANGKPVLPFIWMLHQDGQSGNATVVGSLSGISTGNPAVVTTDSANNIQTGDHVYLYSLTGTNKAAVENKAFEVTRIDATNFSLNNTNGSGLNVTDGTFWRLVPDRVWREILDRVNEKANGAVVWGAYSNLEWYEAAPWWRQLKRWNKAIPYGYTLKPKKRR